ncbi:DUF3035 domain-containing protein [Aliiroseovarius marinus]|uniref:DUF3035 domain-containing protein n=1 Tax=Aliiroseovarius marinus TaxID=2500159 RepID=UPI003D7DD5E4
MRGSSLKILAISAALAVLAGCSSGNEPKLLNIKATQGGPDEFAILPTKPLTPPKDFSALPTPTPGGANLTDPTPLADAAQALGGRANTAKLRGSEVAIVNAASRYGVAPNIRQSLAAEDLEWRKNNRGKVLERLFNVNVYYRAYEAQELDQHRELERLRRRGLWTPAAPPDPSLVVE